MSLLSDRELNILLRERARAHGLCDAWYLSWGDDDTIDMDLDRFVRGIYFSAAHDWLPLDFVRAHFSLELLHSHGIYLDEAVDISDARGTYVFLGNCSGRLSFAGYSVGDVYLFGGTCISVDAGDMSKVYVTCYGDSICLSSVSDEGLVRVYPKNRMKE